MDRASDYGSEGWEFESLRARQTSAPRPLVTKDDVVHISGEGEQNPNRYPIVRWGEAQS